MLLKKIARISLYVFISLILILLLVQVSVNFYINKRLANDLKEQVSEATHGQYTLNIEAAGLSFLNRSIAFDNIEFIPADCKECHIARYKVTAKSISVDGIDVWNYIKHKSISASSLNFEDLSINIYQAKRLITKKDTVAKRLSLYKILSKNLTELTVRNINVTNTKLRIFKADNDSVEVMLSDDNDISIEKFLFNSRVDSMGRLFLADKISMSMKTFSYSLPTGLYTIKGKNMVASYSDSLLTIDSLELLPNFSKKTFSKAAGKQVSRVKLNLSGITFSNMDLDLFIEHNWFISKKLEIETMGLNVYRDLNAEFKPKRQPSMQQILRSIPFVVKIDTVKINNSNIVYAHLAKEKEQPGKITFNHLKGLITGLENDTASFTNNSHMVMRLNASFMNKAHISAKYVFPLNTATEVFDCSGKLTNMSMTDLNNMLENTISVSIKSGMIDTMSFAFHANDQRSKGTMKFLYHDLKVELLNKDDKKQNLKKKIMSYLANEFVINDQNPKKGQPPTITDIGYERYPYKFLFYYTWKTLQSGILPAIGIKNPPIHAKEPLPKK